MSRNAYRFRSMWHAEATADETYRALRELGDYPAWWPEVRRAERVDDSTYDMVVRSLLPYDLAFRTTRSRDDPARVLEARMTGDLEGFSRWTLTPGLRALTTLVFEEEVVACKPLLRRLGLVGRPAFVANHRLMMRHGQRGLRAYLAGLRRGAT